MRECTQCCPFSLERWLPPTRFPSLPTSGALCWVTPSQGPVINKEKPLPINTAACSTPRPDNDSHPIVCQFYIRDFMGEIMMAQRGKVPPLPQWTGGSESMGEFQSLLPRATQLAW